uniref:NADH dehydrogenase subunit 6 n=1 Tax=Mesabolivar sp. ITV1036I2 TaxID=2508675 RepID=A0A411FER4_9ARAC|nr:NADH dehydrogenase subunit 6 [Mesabolivar sp. ITV1036I2]
MLLMVMLLVLFVIMISHPMLMVVLFMILSLYLTIFMYFEYQTFWFSVLFMLVVLSGVMVLFMYMASLTPNDGFFLDLVVMFFVFVFVSDLDLGVGFMDSSCYSLRLWEDCDGMLSLYSLVMLLLAMFVVVWLGESWRGCVRV